MLVGLVVGVGVGTAIAGSTLGTAVAGDGRASVTALGVTEGADGLSAADGVVVMVAKMSASCCKAARWMSAWGGRGSASDGLRRASTRSCLGGGSGEVERGCEGHVDVGWEPCQGVGDAFDRCGVGPNGVAAIVLQGGPDVPALTACGAQVSRTVEGWWMRTRVPGGASGVRLMSKAP